MHRYTKEQPNELFDIFFWTIDFRLSHTTCKYTLLDHIDVGDGCWRRNVLVTTIQNWWPTSTFLHWSRAPSFKRFHHDRNSVSNIRKLSPIWSHHHHCQIENWFRCNRIELCPVTVKLWIILLLRKLFNIERFETLGKE